MVADKQVPSKRGNWKRRRQSKYLEAHRGGTVDSQALLTPSIPYSVDREGFTCVTKELNYAL